MSTIALTVAVSSVTVADLRATVTASVTNTGTAPDRIVLGAFGPPGGGPSGVAWTSVDRPARDVAPGATEQYAVTFVPPAGTAAGSYPVRFIAYSADQAPEEHADQARQVDVVVPPAPVPPTPPPKKPWWPWALAAALVVVVGLVAWFVLHDSGVPGGGGTASTSTTTTPSVPLEGTEWKLVSFEQGTTLVTGTTITLTFHAGVVSGRACNSYGGPVTLNGSGLVVGSLQSTMMLCTGQGVMAQEQRYFTTLRAATAIVRQASTLVLTTPDGRSLTFHA